MEKKNYIILILTILLGFSANAQRTVSGTVKSSVDGKSIAGATIQLIGTSLGTKTNSEGDFTLQISENGKKIKVSYIGFESQTLDVGDNLTITLQEDKKRIDEVVVTAQGIRRKKNTLPYAATQVAGEEVSQSRTNNFAQTLSGKSSGLEIKQSNSLGGSTNIIIRGSKSLTRSNQALIVVDGVPYTNNNENEGDQRRGYGGYDYGNSLADINPDDIESISVLKGAAASALYGSAGGNGVIMVTTKKGKKTKSRELGINFQTGFSLGIVDKSTLPVYQKMFGAGNGLDQVDLDGDGVDDYVTQTYEDAASSGELFDANKLVYTWESFDPKSPNYMKKMPYVAAENDANSFYNNSVSLNNSIFVTSSQDKLFYKLGYTRNDDWGILPNSKVTKNLINLSGSYDILDNLTLSADFNYSRTDGKGRYGTGYDANNIMGNFRQWFQTGVDIKEQEAAYYRNNGLNATWNIADNTVFDKDVFSMSNHPNYWNNPYFTRYKNYQTDYRDRIFSTFSANYKLTSYLNLLGRMNIDYYNNVQEERIANGSIGSALQGMATDQLSGYSKKVSSQYNKQFDLIANFDKDITSDFNLKSIFGWNYRIQDFTSVLNSTNGGLYVPNLFAISNSKNTPNAATEAQIQEKLMGLYAGTTLTFKEMLILDATLRRDESTTLPSNNNVYWYPSASLGFIFSKWNVLNNGFLNSDKTFGKLRLNYAEVGNSAPAYSNSDYFYFSSNFGSTPMYAASVTKNNPNLKPERSKSWEAGLEMTFLNNRFGFDLTYYNIRSVDQIMPVQVSAATGYTTKYVNAGVLENQGVELQLFGNPVRRKDFSWDFTINWTKNVNKVIELYDANMKSLTVSSFPGGSMSLNAVVGEAYGQLRGKDYVYAPDGQRVVNSNGRYAITTTTDNPIGNIQPNWIAGVTNKFRYKDFTFSFLIDIKNGGDVFSLDQYYGQSTGLYQNTIKYNENGVLERLPISEGGGLILPGVVKNSDGTYSQNTTRIEANPDGYGLVYGGYYAPSKEFVYDASYVKLREITIGYNIPKKVFAKNKFIKNASINFVARNLFILYKNLPYADPEDIMSSGNAQGFQTGSMPNIKSIGLNFKLGF